jgi:hypothetical protein
MEVLNSLTMVRISAFQPIASNYHLTVHHA